MINAIEYIIEYVLNNEYILQNDRIIGFLHFLGFISVSIYGFVFSKHGLDPLYLFYTILIFIGWTIYNGECPLIYYVKKKYNPDYLPGDNYDFTDMYLLIGSKDIVDTVVFFCVDLFAVSLYIVLKRNEYPHFLCIGVPFFFILYISLKLMTKYLGEQDIFVYLNDVFRNISILLFLLIILYSPELF